MENPYVTLVASSASIINRLDLQPGMTVLDIGAGSGRITLAAARIVGKTGRVIALDVQPAMLERIRQRARDSGLWNIQYLAAEISSADLVASTIDRAAMVIMLGEIPNREAALQQIYTALKPGGILSITESLPDPQYQTRSSVLRFARDTGFDLVGEFGNFWSFTLNFRKPGFPADPAPDRSGPE